VKSKKRLEKKVIKIALKEKIMNRAFLILARRSQAEKELEAKLLRKFPTPVLVKKTIKRLKDLGYLNDEKFTREWVDYRLGRRPKGKLLIKRELLAKGVNPELVEKVLQLVYNRGRERKELTNLLALIESNYPKGLKGKRRLVSYLLRRGFLWEDIRDIMESGEKYS